MEREAGKKFNQKQPLLTVRLGVAWTADGTEYVWGDMVRDMGPLAGTKSPIFFLRLILESFSTRSF